MCGLTRCMSSLRGMLHGTVPLGRAYTLVPSSVVLLDTLGESKRGRLAFGSSLFGAAGGGTGMFRSWNSTGILITQLHYPTKSSIHRSSHNIMLEGFSMKLFKIINDIAIKKLVSKLIMKINKFKQ